MKIATLLASTLLSLALFLPATAYGQTVRFGWVKVIAGPAVYLVPQFSDKQVKLEFLEFKRFPDIRTALTSGNVDIGMLGAQEVPLVLSRGVTNLVVIAGIDVGGTGLIARKGISIKKWSDLYGKRIAAGVGGSAWTQFVAATNENGLEYRKLNIHNIVGGGFDHVRALQHGDADVVVSWEPYQAAAVVSGAGNYTPLDITNTRSAGGQVTVIATTKEFAAKHPEAVTKVLSALLQSMDHLKRNPTQWRQVLVGWGFDERVASVAIEHVNLSPNLEQERIKSLARFLFEVGLAKSDVSGQLFPEYFTYEFLTKASGKSAKDLGAAQ